MSDAISMELQFFFVSVAWGISLLFTYDIIRIFRRLIKHVWFFIALEDIIFWVIGAVLIFGMIYEQNNGTIRGFAILGMVLGMVIYNQSLSNYFVVWVSKCFLFLTEKLRKGVQFLFKPIKKLLITIQKTLKKKKQESKIKRSNKKNK